MAKKEKVKYIIDDKDGKKLDEFESKVTTALFNKLPQGTPVKLSIDEGKDFGKQFVGDYITKGLPNQPVEPTCPAGEHWDDTLDKCVADIPEPPDHQCPTGEHWDEATQSCVPNTTPPDQGNVLWDSNVNGKWNNGQKRIVKKSEGDITPDGKGLYTAASGSPELIIDGDGVAHLHGGTGGVDNLSLKLKSRHQEGGDPANRAGGEGVGISRNDWDIKRENFHNDHTSLGNGKLSNSIKDNEWHHAEFSCQDEGSNKMRLILKIDGKEEANVTDSSAGSVFFDKALLQKNSYFWIRINNSDHPRIYVLAKNYDSKLSLDFKFEPATSSVGLKNVQLVAI